MTLASPSVPTPRFGAGHLDRIHIDGIPVRRVRSDRDMMTVIRCDDTEGLHETYTHAELYRLLDEGRLEVERNYFCPGKGRLRVLYGDLKLTDLDPETQEEINWKGELVERFLRLASKDRRIKRSDPSLRKAIERICEEIKNDRKAGKPSVRPGKKQQDPTPPSPTQLRRWIKRFEDGGFERIALHHLYARSGRRTPQLDPDVRAIMNKVVPTYASNLRQSGKKIHGKIEEEIGKLNDTRKAAGLPELKVPSLKTVYRAIQKLDAFQVVAGRKGKEYARKKFFVVHEGLEVTRLLERVEIDTWEVQLTTLLVDMGLWSEMSEKEREAVTRVRCYLTAAIDCASRYVLALILRTKPADADSVVAAIQMITADKAPLSTACGARTPWHGRGTPETVVTDRGPEHIHEFFRSTLSDLGTTHVLAPGGVPQMRGTIERLFRTIDTTLMSELSGRTFSNPQDKGDYDAKRQASLTVEELRTVLYRWIEAYHNTPHEGLGGETPEQAWARLAKECEVRPAPSPNQARHIFGIRTLRRIGNRGIRFLGLHYQSLEVQRHRRHANQRPVLIRVDPADLGAISVFTEEGWVSAPCVDDFAHGLSVAEWTAATRRLRERFADQAALARPVVLEAIAAIREMSASAMVRADLASPVISDEDFKKAENELFRTFRIRNGNKDAQDAVDDEDDILGIGFSGETAPSNDNEDDTPGDGTTSPYGDADDWSLED